MTDWLGPVLVIAVAGWGAALGMRRGVLFLGAGGMAAVALLMQRVAAESLGGTGAVLVAGLAVVVLSFLLGALLARLPMWWIAMATFVCGAIVALLVGPVVEDTAALAPEAVPVVLAMTAALVAAGGVLGLVSPGWLRGEAGVGVAVAALMAGAAGLLWTALPGTGALGTMDGAVAVPGITLGVLAAIVGGCSPRRWWGPAPVIVVLVAAWLVWPADLASYRLLVLGILGAAWAILVPAGWLEPARTTPDVDVAPVVVQESGP